MNYRRARVPGVTYFFTVTLRDRRSRLLTEHADALREAIRAVKRQSPFRTECRGGICLITCIPCGHSLRAMRIFREGGTPLKCGHPVIAQAQYRPGTQPPRGEYALWQRWYRERVIRDDSDFARHADSIHYNPVKHGWVRQPIEWRWSSVYRYIRLGLLTPDWATASRDGEFGE